MRTLVLIYEAAVKAGSVLRELRPTAAGCLRLPLAEE